MHISSREQFPDLINRYNLRGIGAEIGVKEGKFSRILHKSCLSKIYLVDPWLHYECGTDTVSQEEHDKRYEKVSKEFPHVFRMTSAEACQVFEDGSFDFIYLDAVHTYDYIKQDLEIWFPKVRRGGILSGHDYINAKKFGGFDVKRAVDEFVKKHNLELNITTDEPRWKSWWFRV